MPRLIARARIALAVIDGRALVAAPDDNRNNNARLPQAGD